MVGALERFPSQFPQVLAAPTGGFFVFVRASCDAHALLRTAQGEEFGRISFLPGDRCAATPAGAGALRARGWIRLCFAMLDADTIRRGVRELARAVDAVVAA